MNASYKFVFICFCFERFYCDTTPECQGTLQEPLNGLVVTFAPPNDHSNPFAFTHMPKTEQEAKRQNWTKLDDGCSDMTLQHKGARYIYGDDVSVLLIFGKNGYVAGMQMTLDKATADSGQIVNYETLEYMYQETVLGKPRYMQTFYLKKPSTICTDSTPKSDTDETFENLYYKTGPDTYLNPPLTENTKALTEQNWVKGLCVEDMGMHYYQNAYKNVSCSEMKPYFLMYDCGRLIGMGMFVLGIFKEQRFEPVPEKILPIFIDPVPTCLHDACKKVGRITACHVFFINDPQSIKCPKGTTLADKQQQQNQTSY